MNLNKEIHFNKKIKIFLITLFFIVLWYSYSFLTGVILVIISIVALKLIDRRNTKDKQDEKQIYTYFWNKKVDFGKEIIIVFSVIFLIMFLVGLFSSSNNTSTQTQQNTSNSFVEKTKDVLQSQKERFGCENGKIEKIADTDLINTNTRYKIIGRIPTNIVKYPLNKKEVMIEYCFKIANLYSEIGGTWVTVRFVDKDKNVLAENEERVTDILGGRMKTVYGSKFVDIKLVNEMTMISILIDK